jgi:hypothetical protein
MKKKVYFKIVKTINKGKLNGKGINIYLYLFYFLIFNFFYLIDGIKSICVQHNLFFLKLLSFTINKKHY